MPTKPSQPTKATQPTKPKQKPTRPPNLLQRTLASCPPWLEHYFLSGSPPPDGGSVEGHDYAALKYNDGAMELLWDKHEGHIMSLAKRQGVEPYGLEVFGA